MKNKYELKLEQLLEKYGLTYQQTVDSFRIHNIVLELFETRCDGKRIAIWGAGRKNTENSHAAILLKKYATYIQGVCCIVDSSREFQGDDFLGYPIISPHDISQYNIDIVIVASRAQSLSIIEDLNQCAPECDYIDIYGELRSRGIEIVRNFYEESNVYTELYEIRKKYESVAAYQKRDELFKLICAYLSIRDFYYAKKYIKEYVLMEYANHKKLRLFLKELEDLEEEIICVNQKKAEDIVIFFLDSLRAIDLFHKEDSGHYVADLFKNYLEKSVVFTNVKSTGITTYESMASILKQKYPYEENVYDNVLSKFEEFALLPLVKKMGYQINLYVSVGYQIVEDHESINFCKQVYLTTKLWKLVTDMACASGKTFNLISIPYELHFPLVCGFHTKRPVESGFTDVGVCETKAFVPRQLEECKSYVDHEFEYYRKWFSDEILFSIFSDHSQVIYDDKEQKPYFMYYNDPDKTVNASWFIKGFGLNHCWNEQLFSLYDFCSIMTQLIENRKLEILERALVVFQYYKIHNKKLREYARENGLEDYIDGMQCFLSNEGIYMITAHGKEEAYLLGSRDNIINSELGKKMKKEAELKFGLDFPPFITDAL